MSSRVSLFSLVLVFLGLLQFHAAAQIVVGSLVRTTESGVEVRSSAGPFGTLAGTQGSGSRGTTLSTQTFEGVVYWRVNFDTSPDGWVLGSKLELAPASTISLTAISPAAIPAGVNTVTLTLTGTGFTADDLVYMREPGAFVDTFVAGSVFDSPTSITVQVTPGLTPGLGYFYVARAFEDEQSQHVSYTVEAPVPVITTVTPLEILTGTSPEIQITGEGLMNTSYIYFNGAQLTTTRIRSGDTITGLKATLDPFYTAEAGVFPLAVYTDAPGTASGKFSAEQQVSVLDSPDGVPPVIAITEPAAAASLTTTEALFTGTASDDRGTVEVKVRVNGGEWQSAYMQPPATAWRAYVPLVTGENLLEAQALDPSGNVSAILSRSITTTSQYHDGQVLSYSMVDGAFAFTFLSFPGASYNIELTTGDLVNDWYVSAAGWPSSGTSTTYTDQSALEQAPRAFYRARRQ